MTHNNESFASIISLLINKRKQLSFTFLISLTVSAIIVFFVIKVEYYSYASILIESESSIQSALASKMLGKGVADLGIAGISPGNTDLDYINFILKSRSVAYDLTYKYDFKNIYKKDYYFLAVKKLRENTEISSNDDANIISIGFYDEDSIRARDVVNDYLKLLQAKLNELSYLSDSIKFSYLEKRYTQVIDDLYNAESDMSAFQLKNNIMLPEKQIEQSLSAITKIDEELIKLRLGLEYKKVSGLGETEDAKLIQKQINILENTKSNLSTGQNKPFAINLYNGSGLMMEYLRKYRNVKIQTTILELLLPMYEEAKFKASNQKPRFVVVDKAFVPEYKERPKRALLIILFTGFVFALHVMFILISNKIDKMKLEQDSLYFVILNGFKKP